MAEVETERLAFPKGWRWQVRPGVPMVLIILAHTDPFSGVARDVPVD